KMRSPSLTGVGAATQVFSCDIVRPVAQNWRSQRLVPSEARKQMTCRRSCFGPLEQVTNTRSPTMIGLLNPRPGKSAAQAILRRSSCTGRLVSLETPFPCGPRKPGQSARVNEGETIPSQARTTSKTFIIGASFWLASGGGNRRAESVRDPKLEFPFLGPVF